MSVDLPLVFAGLMGFAILAYVVLDGYDLGVGMLMLAAEREDHETMIASIGPFWDANETWLVLGIGLLLVAFPIAHGVVLGALYLPVVAMLREADLIGDGTETEAYMRVACKRYQLMRTHDWSEEIVAHLAREMR